MKKIELIEGVDLTDILNISLYQPPIPAELAGEVEGPFKGFINKTDEERIQNLEDVYEQLKELTFYTTEKLDGTSATYFIKDGEFGVCSRNWQLKYNPTNSYWKFADDNNLKYKMLSLCKLLNTNICLQGELIGEGIQGNPYKIRGQEVRFFNLFDIDNQKYLDFDFMEEILDSFSLKTVPILNKEFKLPNTIKELLELSQGKSALNNQTEREGIVVRTQNKEKSFKVISNKFLLKNGE